LLIHDCNWDIDIIDSSLHTSIVAPHVINPSTLHTRSNIAPFIRVLIHMYLVNFQSILATTT
jgi:hypothetical protein